MSKSRANAETLRTALVAGDVTNANFTGADLELGKGGTGASTAGAARTALGVVIGTDVLAPNGSAANLTNLPASGTAEFVASGVLANGDTVIINANGTVSVVAETINTTPVVGTPVVFEAANSNYISVAYDSNSKKIVVAYQDIGNSQYGTAIVGQVSGNTISFGTAVVYNSVSSAWTSVAFDSSNNKIVITWNQSGSYSRAIVGTVSGTSISFGSPVIYSTGSDTHLSAVFDSTNNKIVIAYSDGNNNNYGTAIVGTVSGTDISFGGATVFKTETVIWVAATYDSTNNRVVISYRDFGNNDYGTSSVGTVSGTGISFANAVVFKSARVDNVETTFDSSNGKVVIVWASQTNPKYGLAIVGTVSNTSISFGSMATFKNAAVTDVNITYDSKASKVVISYVQSNVGKMIVGTVAGTNISFASDTTFASGSFTRMESAYDSQNEKVVAVYRNGSNSSYGTSVVFASQTSATNMTTENYIGVSDGAYSNAATATIQIIGSIDDAQTGLTAGKSHYVQKNGSLSTSPNTPSVFAGTAVSATKLIIKG